MGKTSKEMTSPADQANVRGMNRRQQIVLLAGVVCIALMLLFPPTKVVYQGATTYGGFRFLFSLDGVLMVAWKQQIAQILGVVAMALLLQMALRGR